MQVMLLLLLLILLLLCLLMYPGAAGLLRAGSARLGEGGFGVVYKAVMHASGRGGRQACQGGGGRDWRVWLTVRDVLQALRRYLSVVVIMSPSMLRCLQR